MSKRCCAQNCFNSTLYTKNISYFHFPKNKKFADQWSDLAGRSDLKNKPLLQVIKYFLCSEHFATNCFVDQSTRQILKRNLPHSIALPTIFKNNLQETMHISNPKQTIEVHNIVILDSEENTEEHWMEEKTIGDDVQFLEGSSGKDVDNFVDDTKQQPITKEKEPNSLELRDQLTCIDEDTLEPEQTNCSENSAPTPQRECRLCLTTLTNDEPTTKFQESQHLQEFIKRVMYDKITLNDEFSQIVCKNCENNSLLCLIIIQQMDATQEKIVSSANPLS